MIFRQLYDSVSSTYTYLLGCEHTREAVIIDPVFERVDRDTALLRELGLNLRYSIDTHVHADHVTASWLLRYRLQASIVLSVEYPEASNVDIAIGDGEVLAFGNCSLRVIATPGHTGGCISLATNDNAMVFAGDCLMIRGAGRTDFQSGDVHTMWHSIREKLFVLPDECLVYPGHDYQGRTVSTIAEEKRFNPRIGGDAREEDFAGYMENLGLVHPRLLEIAVPANLKCGEPESPPQPIAWGPVSVSFAGVPEIRPDWVARNYADLCIVDVRKEQEYDLELGHLENSRLIPLDELRNRTNELPREKTILTICQSGKRSAMAVDILLNAGFDQVANIPGGLIQWAQLGLPYRVES